MDFQYDDPFHYSRPCQLFRVHKMVEAVIRSVDKRTACTLEAALNNMTVPLHGPKTSLNIYSTWGPLCNGCYVLFRGARKEKISGMMSRNYVATKSSATKRIDWKKGTNTSLSAGDRGRVQSAGHINYVYSQGRMYLHVCPVRLEPESTRCRRRMV